MIKYYAYIHKLLNNKMIDFQNYLIILKNKFQFERKSICTNEAKSSKIDELNFIFDSLYSNMDNICITYMKKDT